MAERPNEQQGKHLEALVDEHEDEWTSWPAEAMNVLRANYKGISRTFYLLDQNLRTLNPPYTKEADALLWAYSLCRLVDNLADFKIDKDKTKDSEKRRGLGDNFMEALILNEPKKVAIQVVPFMKDLKVDRDKSGYKVLIKNSPELIAAADYFSDRPKMRKDIIQLLGEMVTGFNDPRLKSIETYDKQLLAYYYDAQVPAQMIETVWEAYGHYRNKTSEERKELRSWGNDLAIVLQGANDLKDWRYDIEKKKPKFPLIDVVRNIGGLSEYAQMLDPQHAEATGRILDTQYKLILDHFESAMRYCDGLDYNSVGPRSYAGGALALTAALLRLDGNSIQGLRIDPMETLDIVGVPGKTIGKIGELAQKKLPMKEFFLHLHDRPSEEYIVPSN